MANTTAKAFFSRQRSRFHFKTESNTTKTPLLHHHYQIRLSLTFRHLSKFTRDWFVFTRKWLSWLCYGIMLSTYARIKQFCRLSLECSTGRNAYDYMHNWLQHQNRAHGQRRIISNGICRARVHSCSDKNTSENINTFSIR